MQWPRWGSALVVASVACSTGGVRDPGPVVPWTPGRYLLEADLDAGLGGGTQANELEAELRIQVGGSMMLLSSFGACTEPTREELERDEQFRRRTFSCGEARYEIRPTQDSVRGEVRARVLEEVLQQVPCAPGNPGVCTVVTTRRVARRARLVVTELDRR